MLRFLRADLKRGLTERSFLGALALAFAALALPYFFGSAAHLSGSARFLAAHDALLPYVFPLLSALPYGAMFLRERAGGLDRQIRLMLGRRGYRLRRLVTCWLLGALVLGLPTLMFALPGLGRMTAAAREALLLTPLCGAALSGLSHALSCWNSRSYIPLLAPQVLCLLLIYAAPYLDAPLLWPPLWISPAAQAGWGSAAGSAGLLGALMLFSLVLTALYSEEDGLC